MNDFSSLLLDWYNKNRRVLPWREEPTPYHVYLSEIMLQQTRVSAVIGYYKRFLDAFPTIESLADSSEDEVNKLWEGLGYYSRARNLRKAAMKIVSSYGGIFPQNKKELQMLPGVGDYTSSAIMAIAYDAPYVAVDGNLIRVYSRLMESPLESKSQEMKETARRFYLSRLSIAPSMFNQALMDLGELVCLPHGAPHCHICPFASICKARINHHEYRYPVTKEKPKKTSVDITLFLIRFENSILIRKRDNQGLFASMYELPSVERKLSKNEAEKELIREGFAIRSIESLPKKRHVFTHLVWNMEAYLVEVSSSLHGGLFVKKEELEERYSLPSAFRHYEANFFQ